MAQLIKIKNPRGPGFWWIDPADPRVGTEFERWVEPDATADSPPPAGKAPGIPVPGPAPEAQPAARNDVAAYDIPIADEPAAPSRKARVPRRA